MKNLSKRATARRLVAFTLAVGLSLALVGQSEATDFVNFDGTWWAQLTDQEQVVAVEGFLGGYETGYNDGYVHAALLDNEHYHSTRTDAQLSNDPATHVSFSKTFGTYQQEIIDFYSAHSKSDSVLVSDVISCLSDNPLFSCDEVAKLTH